MRVGQRFLWRKTNCNSSNKQYPCKRVYAKRQQTVAWDQNGFVLMTEICEANELYVWKTSKQSHHSRSGQPACHYLNLFRPCARILPLLFVLPGMSMTVFYAITHEIEQQIVCTHVLVSCTLCAECAYLQSFSSSGFFFL